MRDRQDVDTQDRISRDGLTFAFRYEKEKHRTVVTIRRNGKTLDYFSVYGGLSDTQRKHLIRDFRDRYR